MARTSMIDEILVGMATEAGAEGVTIEQMTQRVVLQTEGARGVRGVETQARKLVEEGKLSRKYVYFYPTLADGTQMKSPVRRYVYFLPQYLLFNR